MALFIATANDLSQIPAPLRDRMEIIEIAGYTPVEKAVIARKHLLQKAAENAGLQVDDVDVDDATIASIIQGWTREAGVRQLQRTLGRLYPRGDGGWTRRGWASATTSQTSCILRRGLTMRFALQTHEEYARFKGRLLSGDGMPLRLCGCGQRLLRRLPLSRRLFALGS